MVPKHQPDLTIIRIEPDFPSLGLFDSAVDGFVHDVRPVVQRSKPWPSDPEPMFDPLFWWLDNGKITLKPHINAKQWGKYGFTMLNDG